MKQLSISIQQNQPEQFLLILQSRQTGQQDNIAVQMKYGTNC